MVTVACILMALGALAFVLFVEPRQAAASAVDQQLVPLERKKEVLYENLRDLNFEYRMGKLSEADYQSAKMAAQAELVPVLSALEELEAQKLREEVTPPPGWCERCTHQNPPDNVFCGQCGASLKKRRK
jgi:hypothetical protein